MKRILFLFLFAAVPAWSVELGDVDGFLEQARLSPAPPAPAGHQIEDSPAASAGPEQAEGILERSAYKNGICGVYNPATGRVEWRQAYKNGVAGVYNPETKQVEWKQAYKNGVAGVYNPETKQVEWKQAYKNGVAGVYNPATKQVEWKQAYKNGVTLVSTYREAPTLNCASFYGDDD